LKLGKVVNRNKVCSDFIEQRGFADSMIFTGTKWHKPRVVLRLPCLAGNDRSPAPAIEEPS
jgi:hypothetical protein